MYFCTLKKIMKRVLIVLGLIGLLGLSACHSKNEGNVLISRAFLTNCWERFDFLECSVELEKPTTYNLSLDASFNPDYPFDYFAMVFTVFDEENHPLRSRSYQFKLKDRNGLWLSECTDGVYRYNFLINNELSLNESGKYLFQIENRMPITPLMGVVEIALTNQ